MTMIQYMIPLVESWLPIWNNYIVYVFALAFLGWFPSFVISLVRR